MMAQSPLAKTQAQLAIGTRKRGRPSNLLKYLARQGDLFSEERFLAALSAKYPMLAMCATPGVRPQRGTSEDARPEDALGKPIRDLLPLPATVEK